MKSFSQNIRYALRMLAKNPGFTLVAVLTIALGVGANSVIFSAINAILLQPLPYKDADRLVVVWETNRGVDIGTPNLPVSSPDFFDWRNQNHVFDGLVAFRAQGYNMQVSGDTERVDGARVSADFFPLLGIQPLEGRAFATADDQPGGQAVALISQGLKMRRFGGGSPVGRSVVLNDKEYTIVGVMPSNLTFLARKADVWVPIALNPNDTVSRGSRNLLIVGRLKSGATVTDAQNEMAGIARNLEQQYPEDNSGWGTAVVPLEKEEVRNIEQPLLILFAAVILVLLIACANVASLLLARAANRQKEIAIRLALGATRGDLIWQFLTESIVLALVGFVLAALLAYWGIGLLVSLSPAELPRIQEVGVDGRVIVFTLLVSLITGLIFGLVPAVQASKPHLSEVLKEGAKGSKSDMRKNPTRAFLVVLDFAVALVLVVGAGLLIKNLQRLTDTDPGYQPSHVLTFKISLSPNKYRKPDQQLAFFKQVVEKLETVPNVHAVGATSGLPLAGLQRAVTFFIEGRPRVTNPDDLPIAGYRIVSPHYFNAMGIPLTRGREFSDHDMADSPKAVMINETLARTFWPGENPLGKRVNLEDAKDDNDQPIYTEIVGVVKDIKQVGLDSDSKAEMYVPYTQVPAPQMNLVVRADTKPETLIYDLRREVMGVDREQPIFDIKPMDLILYESVWKQRFSMVLLNIFAGVALVLSAVGIYGLMSYQVAQRTREIGIRMALGASPSQILIMVLKQAMGLAGLGVIIGMVGAFALTRAASGLLYGVSVTDPVIFGLVALLLLGVGALASYIPARRAVKIEPTVALRSE